jgi:hypothetical protein
MFWSSGKRRRWPLKFAENPPTLTDVFNSVFTMELPPYAKNDKIWLMKLAA